MSVDVTYQAKCTVVETLTLDSAPDATSLITHSSFNTTAALTSATTPPVTKVAAFDQALTAGAATIDLTSLTGTNGGSVDGTGLKVQVAKFKNKAGNSPITVTFGAATGYLLGGAGFKWILSAGQEITIYGNDAAPDISGSLKHIDLAGTGAEELEVMLVMG